MAYQKLQAGRGIAVITSNTVDIPFPGTTKQGQQSNTSTGGGGVQLNDTAALFITRGVVIGDIIYNTTAGKCALVSSVVSETQIICSDAIFTGTSEKYFVFDKTGNNGCVLYVGGAGNLSVRTVGGDTIVLNGVSAGQFIPVQVLGVNSGTTATNIVALW